jgi:hypothetical protein
MIDALLENLDWLTLHLCFVLPPAIDAPEATPVTQLLRYMSEKALSLTCGTQQALFDSWQIFDRTLLVTASRCYSAITNYNFYFQLAQRDTCAW